MLIIGITTYLFPVMKELSTKEGKQAFKAKVDESSVWGFLTLLGLQVAQIFLFIIPGEPIEILAGVCYGTIWGTLFIMFSTLIITTAIVLLVKKYGRKFVYEFGNKKTVDKILNNKFLQDDKKIEFIMFLLFFIPGTPKDLLTYIGALLPIKSVKFIAISVFARIPSIVSSTIAGENILAGNWKLAILLYGAIFLIVAVIVLIIDKNKISKHIIKDFGKK